MWCVSVIFRVPDVYEIFVLFLVGKVCKHDVNGQCFLTLCLSLKLVIPKLNQGQPKSRH